MSGMELTNTQASGQKPEMIKNDLMLLKRREVNDGKKNPCGLGPISPTDHPLLWKTIWLIVRAKSATGHKAGNANKMMGK